MSARPNHLPALGCKWRRRAQEYEDYANQILRITTSQSIKKTIVPLDKCGVEGNNFIGQHFKPAYVAA